MNREQRRQQQRQQRQAVRQQRHSQPRELELTRQQMVAGLIKNGITVDDLRKEYDKGYRNGFANGSDPVIRTCYAAICLALNDLYGYGSEECQAVLERVDYHVLNTLASQEAIDEVYQRMRLEIDFKESFDRVQDLGGEYE